MDRKVINRLVAKAWTDSEYRRRLINEPRKCLQEAGIALGGLVVVVVSVVGQADAATATVEQRLGRELREDETVCEIVIPPRPDDLNSESIKPESSFLPQRATGSCC